MAAVAGVTVYESGPAMADVSGRLGYCNDVWRLHRAERGRWTFYVLCRGRTGVGGRAGSGRKVRPSAAKLAQSEHGSDHHGTSCLPHNMNLQAEPTETAADTMTIDHLKLHTTHYTT